MDVNDPPEKNIKSDEESVDVRIKIVLEEEEEEEDDESFCVAILSNLLFILGSILYLIMSVEDLSWWKYALKVPDEVLEAEDDWTWYAWYNVTEVDAWEDDYVFAVNNEHWVTRYMMLYFSAALSFLATGFLDWWNYREWFSVIMIIAAIFGIVSSFFVVENERLSIIFNSVSVHLFALEAITIICTRQTKKYWLYTGDVLFLAGTVIDVVLSYFHVMDSFGVPHARSSIAAAFFWLACSVAYTGETIYERVRPEGEVPAKTAE